MLQLKDIGSPQVVVSSQLMQNYRIASKINTDSQLNTVLDANNKLHILFVGHEKHAYDVYMDDSSDTGWNVLDLSYPFFNAALVINGLIDDQGNLIYFLTTTLGTAYWMRDAVNWEILASDHNYTGIRVGYGYAVFGYIDGAISSYKTLYPALGPWQGASPSNALWDWRIGLTNAGVGLFQSKTSIVTTNDSGLEVQLPGDAVFGTYSLDTNNFSQFSNSWFGWIAITADAQALSKVFVLDNASKQVSRANYSDASKHTDFPCHLLTGQASLQFLALVATGTDGYSDLFMIGTDGCLYHTRESNWSNSELVKIHDLPYWKNFGACQDANNNAMLFAITLDGQLYQIYQDPSTTDWVFTQIEIGTGEAEMIQSYNTQIGLIDANGAPLINTAVTLSSSDTGMVMVNGTGLWLEAGKPLSVQTNAVGKLSVIMEVDSLTAMTLKLTAPFMTGSECIIIEPNADLQNTMANLKPQTLLNPSNQYGQPITLLQGNFNTPEVASALANALNQSAQLMYQPVATDQKYLAANSNQRGLHYLARDEGDFKRRINVATMPDSQWELSFNGNGIPSFTTTTRARAVALMAERNANLPSAIELFGTDVTWGDIWNAVGDKVAEIGDIVVSAVIDTTTKIVQSIQSQITLLVDGIKYVFNAVVSLVEQAIGMIQGILQKVGLQFQDLFDWLGKIFAWDDINRTAEVLEYSLGVVLDFGLLAIGKLETAVDSNIKQFFDGLGQQIDTLIASIPESLSFRQSYDQYVGDYAQPVPLLEQNTSHNPLLDALLNNLDLAQTPKIFEFKDPNGFISQLLQKLEELANEFNSGEGKKAFDDAYAFIAQIGQHPEQFWELSLKALLKVLKGIVILIEDGVRLVVAALFEAFAALIQMVKDFLLETWTIPVVQQMYQLVTGDTLAFRPIRLLSVIVAMAATPMYKALSANNTAPFPDAQSVQNLKNTFTPQWLLNQSQTQSDVKGFQDNDTLRTVFFCCYSATMGVRTVIELAVHVTPWSAAPAIVWFSRFSILGRCLSSVFSTPWVSTPAPITENSSTSPTPLAVLTWGFNCLAGPIVSILFAVSKIDQSAKARDQLLVIWGIVHTMLHIPEPQTTTLQQMAKTEDILNSLITQTLRFLRADELIEPTEGLSLGVYGALTLLGEPAIGILHFKRM